VRFHEHSNERGNERNISVAEMLKVIEVGRPVAKESYFVRQHDLEEERVTFEHTFAHRAAPVRVVACVSDAYPDCVVLTTFIR